VNGHEFFRAAVKTIGEVLRMRLVFVAELVGEGTRLRPLAAWRDESGAGDAGLFDMPESDVSSGACSDLLRVDEPPRSLELGARLADRPELAGLAHVGAAVRRPGGEALGVLCALGERDVVVATDEWIIGIFAERAAVEVERARDEAALLARTAAQLRRQSALVELAQLRTTTLESALRTVLLVSARTLAVERASYWSLVEQGEAIECELLYVLGTGALTRGARLAAATYPAYFSALMTCLAIDASDALSDPRTSEFRVGYFDTFGIGAMLDVPVWRTGRLAGVLCLEHVGGKRMWSPEEQAFATSVGSMISTVLEASARTRAEERYRLVSQAIGETIREWDLETDVVSWNEALQVFGHPIDGDRGGTWWLERIHEDDRARVSAKLQSTFAGSAAAWTDEYRFVCGDATSAYVVDKGFITRDEAGRAIRMTGAMRDVTAAKALEQRVLIADRMASMGTLAAGVAHEINNPLSYVQGNLDYAIESLAAENLVDPELVMALEDARAGSLRVRDIVRDLKMFTRLDVQAKQPVDVESAVASAVAMAWNEVRHRAKLVRRAGNPPPVLATEARLSQVVLNLIVNAAQAIPEGATETNEVRVETGVADDGRVFIEVADSGSGIPYEVQRRIFDPFFTTKAVGHGTGLGLAICHSIVTELGGEITVDSRPDRGAIFRVLLAPTTERAPAPTVGSESYPTPLRRARILVVDDDTSVAVTVKRMLARQHEVVVAYGGRDALALLLEDPAFDVIVCDVMMPDISGVDVHAELTRRAPDLARKLVFMSGGAFTPMAGVFFATTPQPVIQKPFAPEELRLLLESFLSRDRS
jgi:PAS domain S-box-containing protein